MKVSLRVDLWETHTTTAVYLECYQINLTYATRVVYPFWNPSNILSISLLNIPPPKYKPTRINFKNIMLTLFFCKWWVIVRVYAQSVLTGFYGLTTWNYGWIMFLRIMLVGWAVIPKYVIEQSPLQSTLLKLYKWTNWRNCKTVYIHCAMSSTDPHWPPLSSSDTHGPPQSLTDSQMTSRDLYWSKWSQLSSIKPNEAPTEAHWPPLSCRDPLLTHNDTCLSKMTPMWLQITLINSRFSLKCFKGRQPKQFHQLPSTSAVFPSKGNQSCHMTLSLT